MTVLSRADAPPLILASRSAARLPCCVRPASPFTAVQALVDEASLRECLRAEGVPAEEAAVALAELKAHHRRRRGPQPRRSCSAPTSSSSSRASGWRSR